MLRLWRAYRPGMGAGYLPESGGLMDQAAIMLAAFDIMTAAETELKGE